MKSAFSVLTVDTNDVPEDEDAKNEPTTEPDELLESLPPMNPVEIQHDESEKESEFFFAIQSFLKDIHELRDIVQESWFAYKDGKCDLMHASIIANTAIDLVRHAESQFDLLLERPKKYPQNSFPVRVLPALLFMRLHVGMNMNPSSERDFLFPSSYLMPGSHRCQDVYWCLWPVYSGLKCCLDRILRSKDPETACPVMSETTSAEVSGAHKDTYRTLELASLYRQNWLKTRIGITLDEVTRGMAHMFTHRKVPVWTTFGIQILLDVQDILTKDHLEDPLNELRVRVDREIATKEALERSWASPFMPEPPAESIRKSMTQDLAYVKGAMNERCKRLKLDPIRCGLLMYRTYLEVNNTNSRLEGALGHIAMMVHMYAATRLIAPESPVWPDMEYFIYQQGPTRVFFGGWPKTLDECYRKATLTIGRSHADEARRLVQRRTSSRPASQ
ncbi:hypothetical protein ACET3X_003773 [Alternaria dauci]|uniref:DUF6604 domain-containing protein n=1 Tax=Alternaria dauci TaxID=48095 RepID=A0ABR3UL32_9PLEO